MPESLQARAYEDTSLPIGHGQTISQPYTVAYMTQLLDVQPGNCVLEIGTGSGYQTAILCALGARVWSVELVPELVIVRVGCWNRSAFDLRSSSVMVGQGIPMLHRTIGLS